MRGRCEFFHAQDAWARCTRKHASSSTKLTAPYLRHIPPKTSHDRPRSVLVDFKLLLRSTLAPRRHHRLHVVTSSDDETTSIKNAARDTQALKAEVAELMFTDVQVPASPRLCVPVGLMPHRKSAAIHESDLNLPRQALCSVSRHASWTQVLSERLQLRKQLRED